MDRWVGWMEKIRKSYLERGIEFLYEIRIERVVYRDCEEIEIYVGRE